MVHADAGTIYVKQTIEIRKLSGTKFDPELVEIFFEILPNIKQIRQLYPDGSSD